MKLLINADKTTLSVDVKENDAFALIEQALMYAGKNKLQENPVSENPLPESLSDRVYKAWKEAQKNTPEDIEEIQKDGETVKEETEAATTENTFSGFLLIRCKKCGKIRGFCTKQSISSYVCHDCGEETELQNLRPAFLKCDKCGNNYKYRTNVTDELFEYPCVHCGSPIDLKLNGKRQAYVTLT